MNPTIKGLTARQAQVLLFIAESVTRRGFPPTVREIADHLGINSTNGSTSHVSALAHKGMVKITPVTARGMALTDKGRAYIQEHPEPSSEPVIRSTINEETEG